MNGFLSRLSTRLCGRIDFQERVAGPVIVNLLTGFIVFLVLAAAKDWIYPLVLPRPSAIDYPIHVSAEAFNLPTGAVTGEIYVANLTEEPLSDSKLRDWLAKHQGSNPILPDDRIIVEWRRAVGRLTLVNDQSFNVGKGELELTPLSDSHRKWSIRVKDINSRALLRLRVETDYSAPISRADQLGLPFTLMTPRRE